jgi:hypothetical protein
MERAMELMDLKQTRNKLLDCSSLTEKTVSAYSNVEYGEWYLNFCNLGEIKFIFVSDLGYESGVPGGKFGWKNTRGKQNVMQVYF